MKTVVCDDVRKTESTNKKWENLEVTRDFFKAVFHDDAEDSAREPEHCAYFEESVQYGGIGIEKAGCRKNSDHVADPDRDKLAGNHSGSPSFCLSGEGSESVSATPSASTLSGFASSLSLSSQEKYLLFCSAIAAVL